MHWHPLTEKKILRRALSNIVGSRAIKIQEILFPEGLINNFVDLLVSVLPRRQRGVATPNCYARQCSWQPASTSGQEAVTRTSYSNVTSIIPFLKENCSNVGCVLLLSACVCVSSVRFKVLTIQGKLKFEGYDAPYATIYINIKYV